MLHLERLRNDWTTSASFFSIIGETENVTENTVGHLQEHLEAKVVDTEGNVVPMGQPGELYIRGFSTMLGYFEEPEKTAETIGKDKWLRTG